MKKFLTCQAEIEIEFKYSQQNSHTSHHFIRICYNLDKTKISEMVWMELILAVMFVFFAVVIFAGILGMKASK